ncbi:MAG: hypothetical protein ABEN55_16310 [Bradymonadaceae bacterium]
MSAEMTRITAAATGLLSVGLLVAVSLAKAEQEPRPESGHGPSPEQPEASATGSSDAGTPGARSDTGAASRPPDGRAEDAASPTTNPPTLDPKVRDAGRRAFADIAKVLKSPRCMNCHPDGDRPLVDDESRPHPMNISRRSTRLGLPCSTCHRDRNSEAYGVEGGPPGAPHWKLPPEETPMIFEGRSVAELCRQLKDPERNGGKDLESLLEHVTRDPLVLWGWTPGGNRTKPPLSHKEFVEAFRTWVDSRGACPEPND